MPTAAARASAAALPEPTEPPAKHDEFSRIETFGRAYARWLTARAQLADIRAEDDAAVNGMFAEERAAIRDLFLVPAGEDETVWAKLAAFEVDLAREMIGGPAEDSTLFLALGSIKSDLANLGIGGEA